MGRQFSISENYSQVSIITDRYKLGHWIRPPMAERDFRSFGDMLFDRQADPLEVRNLVGDAHYSEVRNQLLGYLGEWELSMLVESDGSCLLP